MPSKDIYSSKFYQRLVNISMHDVLSQYIQLCEKYLENPPIKNFEKHHVFPKSIFGENDVLVKLPIKEHYSAHVLLWKMINQEIDFRSYKKMANAVHKMIQGRSDHFTPDEYETARLAIIEARKGTSTIYDVKQDVYIKENISIIDNKRYFNCFPMIYLPTNKRTWVSVIDPKWVDCVECGTMQRYINVKTGEIEILSSKEFNPEIHRHTRTGKKGTKRNDRTSCFYNPATEQRVRCTKEEAEKLGYFGCSVYTDIYTGDRIYLPPHIAKQFPDRYTHINAGKIDVYLKETMKLIKIKKTDFDAVIHMTKSQHQKLINQH